MQYGMYIDVNRCMGCFACVVACKDWHDIPAGPASWIRIKTVERGRYPKLQVVFLPVLCHHCRHPACVAVCPVGAVRKRPQDGIVVVDQSLCLGKDACGLCREACPYRAPQFGAEENPKMQKCDLCWERLQAGAQPVCVISCPLEALEAGPMEVLRSRYGDERKAEGFLYDPKLEPSVVFKAKPVSPDLQPIRISFTPREGAE